MSNLRALPGAPREPNNFDLDLERAHVAEAVFDFPRFQLARIAPNDFESQQCRWVVEAAVNAWEAGESGIEGVTRALQRQERLKSVDGRQGLMDLIQASGAPDAARFRKLVQLRRLEALLLEGHRAAGLGDLGKAMEIAQEALSAGMARDAAKVKTGTELMQATYDSVAAGKESTRLVYPGVMAIRNAVGDLAIASLTIIAADSGVGKSSLALEMIIGSAEAGGTAGLIGVEDPEHVTGSRLLGAMSDVDSHAIQAGTVNAFTLAQLGRGIGYAAQGSGGRMLLADCTGENDLDICAIMSQMASRGARLIVIDYLTEVVCSTREQDRRNEIRAIASRLKAHAKRIGVALVLVSQVTPDDKAQGKCPTKNQLRDSRDVTQKADYIIALWREDESDFAEVSVKVLKAKGGGGGRWWKMVRTRTGRLIEAGQAASQANQRGLYDDR